MEVLQRLKLLAMQCAAARSPPRSGAGPRRRRTLKRLLARSPIHRPARSRPSDPTEMKSLLGRSLKDLFLSSPPPAAGEGKEAGGVARAFGFGCGSEHPGPPARGRGFPRLGSVGLRFRLLRRPWRPALGAIPE